MSCCNNNGYNQYSNNNNQYNNYYSNNQYNGCGGYTPPGCGGYTPPGCGGENPNPGNGEWIPEGFGSMTEETSALLRIAAHDAYSGVDENGNSYVDGDLFWKALQHPDDPAVAGLLEKESTRKALVQYGLWDMMDDGTFNGSPARHIFDQASWEMTGQHIPGIMNAPLHRADLSQEALDRPNVDNGTADGFRTQAEWMGLSDEELLWTTLWGHEALPSLDDGTFNGSTLQGSLENSNSPDFHVVNATGMHGAVNGLINEEEQRFGQVNGQALHERFVAAIQKMFWR